MNDGLRQESLRRKALGEKAFGKTERNLSVTPIPSGLPQALLLRLQPSC